MVASRAYLAPLLVTLFADDLSKDAYAHRDIHIRFYVQNTEYRMRLTAYNFRNLGGGKEEGGKRR